MIKLGIDTPSASTRNQSSSASATAPQAAAASNAVAFTPSKPAAGKTSLPALTKAELKSAAKGPSHGRRFGLSWLQIGRAKKRLQTLETVSLGDKRFIALVRVDERQFLIGGAPSSVGLLTELAQEESFHQVLNEATQGLNVALETASVATAVIPVAASAALVQQPEPIVDCVEVPAEPTASPDVKAIEAPVLAASAFDEAFMRAYREMYSAPANVSTGSGVLFTPQVNTQQSAMTESSPAPVSDASPSVVLPVALPAVDLYSQLAVEPPPVVKADISFAATERQTPAPSQFAAAPTFTFQNWPAAVPSQPQKQKVAPSLKAASLQTTGFTWSLTGAAS